MKYLISDLNISLDGHKFGFVNNLLHYVGKHKTNDLFVFVVNQSDDFHFHNDFPNIKVVYHTNEENLGMVEKYKSQWQSILSYTKKYDIERLILMELDVYQLEIGKSKTPFKISGIWFRPYSRLQAEGTGLKNKLMFLKNKTQKQLIMKWALRNSSLDKIFILNDEEMPNWLDNTRFFTLPDPYFQYQKLEDFNLREKYNIAQNQLILLQFGYMDERKNNENIIEALNSFPSAEITLLLIGKFRNGYENEVKNLHKGDFQIITRNEFISNEEMESTFSQSDVILRMNVGFFGSSGVVGIAAHHNKPVIVSNTGVMAELVKKYKMGSVVDPYDISAIKKEILSYQFDEKKRVVNGKAYRDSHDLKAFAETLLR